MLPNWKNGKILIFWCIHVFSVLDMFVRSLNISFKTMIQDDHQETTPQSSINIMMIINQQHHNHCELPERASLVLLVHLWLPLEHPHLPPAGQHRRQVKFGQINKFSQNSHRKTNVYMSNTNTSQIEITSKKKTSLHLSNTSQKENQFSPVWSLSKVLSRLKPLEHPHLPPLVTIIDHDHNFFCLFIFHLLIFLSSTFITIIDHDYNWWSFGRFWLLNCNRQTHGSYHHFCLFVFLSFYLFIF